MENKALLKAFELLGSQAELARRLNATRPQVNEWTKRQRPVPLARCQQIEDATDGRVTCEQLRPDVEWLRDVDGRAFYRERPQSETRGVQSTLDELFETETPATPTPETRAA